VVKKQPQLFLIEAELIALLPVQKKGQKAMQDQPLLLTCDTCGAMFPQKWLAFSFLSGATEKEEKVYCCKKCSEVSELPPLKAELFVI